MDSVVGILSPAKHETNILTLAQKMAQVLTDEKTDRNSGFLWSEGHFALVSQPGEVEDSVAIWLNQETLFYFNGYAYLNGRRDAIIYGLPLTAITDTARAVVDNYHRSGVKAFGNLSGSFLLLFYNVARKELVIVSDRFASRPLFFCEGNGRLIFASDIRALLQNPDTARRLDMRSIVEFLRFTMVLGDRTLYMDIKCLQPATALIVSNDGKRYEPYWTMEFHESWDQPDRYYIEHLAHSFQETLNKTIPGDEGVGLMLSGGLDSRMIAASLWSSGRRVTAVSFGGFENDEVRLARRVARVCGFRFAFLKREPEYYFGIFPEAVRISNGLYVFFHAHMLGVHDQVRAQGLHTLIHGWGLDVLFSGSYLPKRAVHHLPGRHFLLIWPRPLRTQEEVADSFYGKLALPMDDLAAKLVAEPYRKMWREYPKQIILDIARVAAQHAQDPYNQHDFMMLSNFTKFRSFLYPLSVRWGVRERCPLFSNDIIDLFLEMPPRLRVCSRAYGKALALLNGALARMPYSRTGASVLYPEMIQTISYALQPALHSLRLKWRRVMGQHKQYPAETFDSYPNVQVLVRTGKFRTFVQEGLLADRLCALGIVDASVVEQMIERHLRGEANYGDYLTALMTLNLWLREWA